VTSDEFGDPATHSIETRLNGVTRQRSGLDDLLISVAQTVAYLSQGYRLRAGDMIAMGTPGALPRARRCDRPRPVAPIWPLPTPGLSHMRPGDVCR
jgi:2-keto-4-pentenoate hydratase/2-oxohepta-3-ene-1,7-dioic acid hydratase in catechol pathway